MSERKVLNKYYPPDFDPAKLVRPKRPKEGPSGGYVVRMMLPMSVKCDTCGEYLYIGTKFNMRKENLTEFYLGTQLFRFYFKCTRCSAEITMKTDPKNSDYICERGASRHYEPWRDMESAIISFKKKRLEEEQGDAMKSLENRTFDSKKEMDILDALNEVKLQNRRHANPDINRMIVMVSRNKELELDKEDEEKLKSFHKRKTAELVPARGEDDEEETGDKQKEPIAGAKPADETAIKTDNSSAEKKLDPVPKVTLTQAKTPPTTTSSGFKLPFRMSIRKKQT